MSKHLANSLLILGLGLMAAFALSQSGMAQGAGDLRLPQAKPGTSSLAEPSTDGAATSLGDGSTGVKDGSGTSELAPRPKPTQPTEPSDETASTDNIAAAKPIKRPAAASEGEADQPGAVDAENEQPSTNSEVAEPPKESSPSTETLESVDASGVPRPRPETEGIGGAGIVDTDNNQVSEVVLVAVPTVLPAGEPVELTAAPADSDLATPLPQDEAEPIGQIAVLVPLPRPETRPAGEQAEDSLIPDGVLAALTPEEASENLDCQWQLRSLGAAFEELEPLDGAGYCGIKAPLRVTELSANVRLTPEAILNCRTAHALALWASETVAPKAEEHLEAKFTGIRHGSTYVCRTRNNQPGAKLSEHATGNAVDIVAIELEEGPPISIVDRSEDETPLRDFQKDIRAGACDHFTTVIGPGSDAFHSTHFHFDMAQRNGGYRLCE